jgi:hypothetical protein
MIVIHDHFSRQMRSRLKTTALGLGLVRLLQDAGLFEEAKTTLAALENGFQRDAAQTDTPAQKPRMASRTIPANESEARTKWPTHLRTSSLTN